MGLGWLRAGVVIKPYSSSGYCCGNWLKYSFKSK